VIALKEFERDLFERDPFALSTEEKIFLVAKRACIGFAAVALTLGVLDIAGIHSITGASDVWQSSRVKILALGDTIRGGVQSISIVTPSSQAAAVVADASSPEAVIVRIPAAPSRRVAVKTSAPFNNVPLANSPIAELSAARSEDAVQMAMAPPPMLAKRNVPAVTSKPELPGSMAMASASKDEARYEPAATTELTRQPIEQIAPAASPVRLASAEAELPPSLPPVAAAEPMISEPLIPLAMVPLPTAAPGVPPPSPAERLGLKGAAYNKAERCLANAVYFESRSEPVRGQMAVAQVVLNRAFSGFYPNDVCSVVYQNASRHLACQFTFACDGKRKVINERGAWARANRIAKQTLEGQIYLPEVAKSTHYHANYVHPSWAHEMKRLAHFGLHSFYRPYAWGNGSEEPVWGKEALAQAQAKKTASK
jgi:hypothetical protein